MFGFLSNLLVKNTVNAQQNRMGAPIMSESEEAKLYNFESLNHINQGKGKVFI